MQREQLRYNSIAALNHQQKLSALKDLSVNPFELQDPQDAVANTLYRWKTIASSPEALKATPEQKQQAASNYYKSVIAPMYERMNQKYGSPIIPEKVWMENAYGSALKYNMDSMYDHHWQSGAYSGFKDFENLIKTGLVMAGGLLRYKTEGIGSVADSQYKPNATAFQDMEAYAKGAPLVGHLIKSINNAISKDSFWQDVNPDTSWGQKATSFLVENAMQLPLYAAVGGFNSGVLEGVIGKISVPLTKMLSQTERGNTALKLLLNGAEGAMYGYTMGDDNDKVQAATQGAIMQSVLGTIFHFKGKDVKLNEVVPPERAAELEHEAEKAEMGIKGWTHNDTESLGNAASEAMRDSSLAGGRPWLVKVLNTAFGHIAETEGMSRADIREQMQENLKNDPATWKHSYIVSGWLRALLGGRKLTELTEAEKEDFSNKVMDRIRTSDILTQAAGSEEEIAQAMKTPVGQQVAKDVGKDNYVKANEMAGKRAVRKAAIKPVDEALDIQEAKEKAKKKTIPTTRMRTSFRGKGADRSVSVGAYQDWKVYAAKHIAQAKAAGFGTNVAAWLKDLPHEEFNKDLYDFFYPKSLKKAGLDMFESGNVKNVGAENPNFLAFMYNLRDRMPPQYREKLYQELVDTAKVQGELNRRAIDRTQLEKYALAMKAHVDELLAAKKYEDPNIKGEVGNVYRSTYDEGYTGDPTEHQMELHEEVIEHERELLGQMFKGKPQQLREAMTAYNLLAGTRTKAFLAGEQQLRVEQQEAIDKFLVEKSQGTKEPYVKWEY